MAGDFFGGLYFVPGKVNSLNDWLGLILGFSQLYKKLRGYT